MLYDLLLKGGTLVDPAQKLHAVQDVAFADGKVTAVGADLSADQARLYGCQKEIFTLGLL